MRPSYQELIGLNPLLVGRTPEEVNALLDSLEECGYVWDDKRKFFHNAELGRGIRTQGLDQFTPDKIRAHHAEALAEIGEDPGGYGTRAAGMGLWQRWAGKLLGLLVLTLLFGWILLPVKYWLGSLAVIAFLFLMLRTISFRMITTGVRRTQDFE